MKKIFFSGIAGSGMSALSILCKEMGFDCLGSDKNTAKAKEMLKGSGIYVCERESQENVTKDIDLLCYSNALETQTHPEILKAKELGIQCMPYQKLLCEVIKTHKKVIGISGTHGKTTTTTGVVEVLINKNPSFLIGSKSINLGKRSSFGSKDLFITEGG